jgi:CheY-like chemotaxis protein/HPt (histidine-containing phosphotransfer) domain-containing protein
MAGERILIVDDNPTNARLATIVLEKSDFEVRHAGDGETALQVVDAFEPELILMDVQLPGMDGLDVTRRIRQRRDHADVVVIALTAYAMKGDDQKAFDAGCDGYIAKPINTRTLARELREYLSRRSAKAPAMRGDTQPETPKSTFDGGAFMEHCGHDPDLAARLARNFMARHPVLMEELRAAVSEGEGGAVERAAHSLRGYLANFYAGRASHAVLLLELAGRRRTLDQAALLFDRAHSEIALLGPLIGAFSGVDQTAGA